MKRNILIIAALGLSLFGLNAQKQINRFVNPTTINAGLRGWNLEWDEGSFTLQTEEDGAIKVVNKDASAAMKGKFQQRFTTSVNGRYTLTFKAKKDAATDQRIEVNLIAIDSWAAISDPKSAITINSDEYAEYTVTFQYSNDEKTIMPHGAQVEIYVAGVTGNLWFKDFMLTEDNNNLLAYSDDFEKNIPTKVNPDNSAVNAWSGDRLQLVKQGDNTVLEYTQAEEMKQSPWDVRLFRYMWSMDGVKYRVQFDMSAGVAIPAENGVGFEMMFEDDKICNQYFNLTTEMQTFDVITKATAKGGSYEPIFYAGRVPANEKLYIDNYSIAPIHLYNATVAKVEGTTVEITWLHSGYLAGDKLNVMLIDGEYEDLIAADLEIVDGKATIELPEELEPGEYQLKLVDAVGEGDFAVGNETVSDAFLYTAQTTGVEQNAENKVNVLVADGIVRIANCPAEAVVTVFSAEGKAIRTLNGVSAREAIRLDAGVYVIRVNDRAFKVAL